MEPWRSPITLSKQFLVDRTKPPAQKGTLLALTSPARRILWVFSFEQCKQVGLKLPLLLLFTLPGTGEVRRLDGTEHTKALSLLWPFSRGLPPELCSSLVEETLGRRSGMIAGGCRDWAWYSGLRTGVLCCPGLHKNFPQRFHCFRTIDKVHANRCTCGDSLGPGQGGSMSEVLAGLAWGPSSDLQHPRKKSGAHS